MEIIEGQIVIDVNGDKLPISSKDIKYMNSINQELKVIFEEYLIKDGLVLTGPDKFLLNKGYHFAMVPFAPLVLNENIGTIVYSSKGIYNAFKANKSKLNSIYYDNTDDCIYVDFTTGDVVLIADIVKSIDIRYHNKFDIYKKHINVPNDFRMIPESSVITMCDKSPVMLESGSELETVITKELIPGMKNTKSKTTKASYAMRETKDPDTFELYLRGDHEFIKSYHKYLCFKW